MILTMLKENILRLILIIGLIIGLQIPNFINQYQQRISAHLIEAESNFKGFQNIADQFYNGDVSKLLQKHEQSEDSIFSSEAEAIRSISDRISMLRIERNSLKNGIVQKIIHIIFSSNKTLLNETYNEYIPTIPLNSEAILCGVCLGFILIILFELFFKRLKRIIFNRRKKMFSKK